MRKNSLRALTAAVIAAVLLLNALGVCSVYAAEGTAEGGLVFSSEEDASFMTEEDAPAEEETLSGAEEAGEPASTPEEAGKTKPETEETGETESAPEETGKTESAPEETGKSESTPEETGKTESAPEETGKTESAPEETDKTQPVPEGAGETESKPEETGTTEQNPSETGKTEQNGKTEETAGENGGTEVKEAGTQEKPEENAASTESEAEKTEEEKTEEDELVNYIEDWDLDDGFVWGGYYRTNAGSLRPRAVLSLKVVTIRSALNKNYVLDVKSAGVKNATKVQLYKDNGTDAQKFILKTNSDGTVTLLAYMCGKAVDVKSNSTANGAQIQIFTANGTGAQKFRMVKNSDGTVTFKGLTSGKAIEVAGGKAANAQGIQLYTANGSKKQKFYLTESTEYRYDYSGKTWLIRSRLDNASVLHVSGISKANAANICLSTTIRNGAQLFKIEPYGGYYRIVNTNSGKVLDVKSGRSAAGTNIQQYAWNESAAQLWKIRLNADGSVTLISALNKDRALEVTGGKTKKGTNIQLGTLASANKQKFFIVESARDIPAVNTKNTGATAWSAANKKVLVNMIGAVESGGQVYGNQNYGAYADPYAVSGLEHTITLGWAQNYGDEAKELIARIFDKDPAAFRKIDKDGQVEAMLDADKDWVAMRWDPSEYKTKYKINGEVLTLKDVIKKLIVTPNGKAAQDELFFDLMSGHISACEKNYTKDVRAVLMYCQIRHLGGQSAVDRIFKRVNGNYSMDSIMASLAMDRLDMKSDNQVGDDKYWSRHEKCREFVQTYAVP